jgi:predicted GNAT superfamily acetyltransferase
MTAVGPAGRPGTYAEAWADAAASAGVTVRTLDSLEDLSRVDALFAAIWGSTGQQVAMPVNLLRALTHSGSYVAGAWRDDQLVGAAVAFLGARDGEAELHSHVAGVSRALQGSGVGLALKLHQRAWAAARGIRRVEWTYDPLVRRNGWFNLVKLGARGIAYYPNFYGIMEDELNGSDETDRCLVSWDLACQAPVASQTPVASATPVASSTPFASATPVASRAPIRSQTAVESEGRPATRLLSSGADGSPVIDGHGPDRPDGALLCQVPEDIVAMRRLQPEMAARWRLALRATMGRAMEAGYVATGMTLDGSYLLERSGP